VASAASYSLHEDSLFRASQKVSPRGNLIKAVRKELSIDSRGERSRSKRKRKSKKQGGGKMNLNTLH